MEIFIRVLGIYFFKKKPIRKYRAQYYNTEIKKNSINGSSNRLDIAAVRISELEDRSEENIRIYIFSEKQRIKNTGKELTRQMGYAKKDFYQCNWNLKRKGER